MLYNKKARGEKLSDLEFLAIKAFEDKIVRTTATLANNGDTCTYTVPDGKTAYIISAIARQIGRSRLNTSITSAAILSMSVDGTRIDRQRKGEDVFRTDALANTITDDKFDVSGLKLEGDGTKSIVITKNSGNPSVYVSITVLLETTGDNPAV